MAAALFLHRDGHRVTIFERFREPRPVGSGLMLQPTGLAVLHQLGLDELAMQAGQRIDRLCGKAQGRTVLDVRYSSMRRTGLFGVGIDRAALFSLIHEALEQANIDIATGHQVTDFETKNGGAYLHFSDATGEGPFDLVVDCLGTKSPLTPAVGKDLAYGALWANASLPDGFDAKALSQRYRRASIMAGLLPTGPSSDRRATMAAFFWSLRAQDYRSWVEGGLDRWKDQVLQLWPATHSVLAEISSAETLTFARYAHKTLARPAGRRHIHIGDSWHSASPQLGQGANMALLDAYALSRALRDSPDLEEGLRRAIVLRRPHIELYQMLTAVLTPVYQSDSRLIPFVRDRLMGPVSKLWPITAFQAALVSGLVGSPLRRLGIDFAPSQSDR